MNLFYLIALTASWYIIKDEAKILKKLLKKMKIQILKIREHGNAAKEYVFMRANEDLDLGDYAIVDTTFNRKGDISNVMRHFYRFPKGYMVKKDERVVLNTYKGKDNANSKSTLGYKIHEFHWGSSAAIWNDENPDVAELLYVRTVERKSA